MRILFAIVAVRVLAFTPAFAAYRLVVFGEAPIERPPFQIVVNPDVSVALIDRKFLEDAFLKKVTRWPDGTPMRPADLTAGSPVRKHFSEEILNRSVEAVRNYWQQKIFSGRDVPPPELDSDDEAVAYVLKHDGGIAYVSPAMKVSGAKVIRWR